MRGILLSAAAAAAVAVPAAAQAPDPPKPPAPPLFQLFEAVCLRTRGEVEKVRARPELRRWAPPPVPVSLTSAGVKLRRKLVLGEGYANKQVAMLLAGEGEFRQGGRVVPGRICSIMLRGADPATTLAAARAWAGVAPTIIGDKTNYRFQETGGRRAPLPTGKLVEVAGALGRGPIVDLDISRKSSRMTITYTLLYP